MACTYLVSDSFDYYTRAHNVINWPYTSVYTGVSGVSHTGPYGMRIRGGDNIWIRYAMPGTPDNASLGVWIKLYEYGHVAYNTDNGIKIRFELTTGEFIGIRWNGTTHTFDAYVDGVKVADGIISVDSDVPWFNVQFYSYIDNAGFIRLRVNYLESINYNDVGIVVISCLS